MLGAQALRTKQKAERKEKEKRHRERLRSIEMQRNQIHRAACEDAAAQFMEISANPPLKVRSMSLCKNGDDVVIVTTKHRHSVHSGTVPHLQVRLQAHRNSSSNGSTDRFDGSEQHMRESPNSRGESAGSYQDLGPQRSTSSDYCRIDKKNSISSTTRLLKWLGISDNDRKDEMQKPMSKRRMSTFT